MRTKKIIKKKTCLQVLKIALPHIGLTLFLLGFLMIGAAVFPKLEESKDREYMDRKFERVKAAYQRVAQVYVNELCPSVALKTPDWRQRLYNSLSKLSSFFENREFLLNADGQQTTEDVLPHRWSTTSSILYALSILTTTGYTYVFPMTPIGQIFAVVYGLIGIPLMVLTAVDIGRFLSDCVLFLYSKGTPFCASLLKLVGCWRSRRRSVIDSVQTITVESTTPMTLSPPIAKALDRMSIKQRSSKRKKKAKAIKMRRLPLWVNASILLLFCMLGGVTYIAFGGHQKTFLEAFFVTFNLVANLTMSEMPNDMNTFLTVVYIVFFVTFGLAVLSMCADLAASELKWLFMKIHYFGRKINWKRRAAAKKEIEMEVKELLKIIEEIRKKYPDKEKITPADILQYIQEMGMPGEYLLTQRRDTIAFMPQSFEALKFADEMDMDDTSHRSVSRMNSNPVIAQV
uniref:Potassium channel domain-containing protein n=1 Tax=Plectus sambesii TaxID=2011161 RepID=A0A914UX15_9BILA